MVPGKKEKRSSSSPTGYLSWDLSLTYHLLSPVASPFSLFTWCCPFAGCDWPPPRRQPSAFHADGGSHQSPTTTTTATARIPRYSCCETPRMRYTCLGTRIRLFVELGTVGTKVFLVSPRDLWRCFRDGVKRIGRDHEAQCCAVCSL